jgi:hypothetical protein
MAKPQYYIYDMINFSAFVMKNQTLFLLIFFCSVNIEPVHVLQKQKGWTKTLCLTSWQFRFSLIRFVFSLGSSSSKTPFCLVKKFFPAFWFVLYSISRSHGLNIFFHFAKIISLLFCFVSFPIWGSFGLTLFDLFRFHKFPQYLRFVLLRFNFDDITSRAVCVRAVV